MKLTIADLEQIINQVKLHPSPEVQALNAKLNEQLVKTTGYKELVHMTSMMIMSRNFGVKEAEFSNVLMEGVGVATMAGALIGYLFGLREAGLEMGISSATDDSSNNS